ncbi:gamma-glutamyltransferase family protein [Paracoccus shanxieyensis]|uniref:Gamma-glutamyltransferase n=1 Tax=Paracoccus shanxieyensis TaxID=2675752 RepID=A0A6L6J253_9RHOB|nr:gamma-glutamyltransferase [Paracoccus shanxieyensis]MTH65918.1 gamma-glutamyltransferase [Paracoccus shanxieyensis]MTH89173.1 gamma-glutamyltransferase [Paracoccus shanxieyensis]
MTVTDIRSPNLSRAISLSKPATRSTGGVVTAQNRQAAQIGAAVLAQGGSAVDAAIATSFALGVLEPWMSGIGGVGAMLVKPDGGPVTAIDAGARSPATLDPADFPLTGGADGDLFGWPSVLEDRNVIGAKSVCIPGLLRGLEAAHARFGRLPWADLVAPAIRLAEDGPIVDTATTAWIAQDMARLIRNEATAAMFLPGGLPLSAPAAVGAKVVRMANPALAATLRRIAAEGPGALYQGQIAEKLAADIQSLGGYLSTDDLSGFDAVVTEAASEPYRDHTLHLLPELNGGVTVALALRNLAQTPKPSGPLPSPAEVVASAKALARAWEHRFAKLGDRAERTLPSCTTHLSVTDRDGMSVSLTQTLLSLFGSRVLSPSTGILLNNGVNWFDPRPGRINAIGPDRKALANYSPMMMSGLDGSVTALGGSGGRKILPAVYQALIHLADYGMTLQEAIAAPRYDLSAPPLIVADMRLGQPVLDALAAEFPTVLTERMMHPNNFTTLGATRRAGGITEGMAEPWHPWAEAVAEGDDLMAIPASYQKD